VSLGGAQRLEAAGGAGDLEPGEAQARREEFQDVRLVLDHQQPGLRALPLGRRSRLTHGDLLPDLVTPGWTLLLRSA
jgi:hypothetical protein